MEKILVFEDNPSAQIGIRKILAIGEYEIFEEIVDSLGKVDAAIARAVAAGVTTAIVDGKLIGGDDDDGKKIVVKLRENGIKSIAYAIIDSGKMGADVVVGKGTSMVELLNGVAQALGSSVR